MPRQRLLSRQPDHASFLVLLMSGIAAFYVRDASLLSSSIFGMMCLMLEGLVVAALSPPIANVCRHCVGAAQLLAMPCLTGVHSVRPHVGRSAHIDVHAHNSRDWVLTGGMMVQACLICVTCFVDHEWERLEFRGQIARRDDVADFCLWSRRRRY